MARHQRLGKIEVQIIKFVTVLPADLHRIAKPRGREQCRWRAFALDQRIGDQSRAMDQRAPLRFDRTVLQNRPKGVFHSEARIARRRQRFPNHSDAILAHPQHVSEGSADINADAVHDSKTVRVTCFSFLAIRLTGSKNSKPKTTNQDYYCANRSSSRWV